MAATFDSLPSELQSSIFRLLDPIALISLSQTGKKFRKFINPTRQLLVERLLAIECLEESGGPPLHFNSRDNAQDPAWDDDKINEMRWACTHCLRLLLHLHFDNHSLLRLGLRKPPPGSQAALPCTSWESNGQIASKAVQVARRDARRSELKKLKRKYAIALTLNWGQSRQSQSAWDRLIEFQDAGLEPFMNMSASEFESMDTFEETQILDGVIEEVERQICGYKRRLRRCNECRYKLGDLRSHTVTQRPIGPGVVQPYKTGANIGTEIVPMVKSRQLHVGTQTHRYFPGFLADLPSCTDDSDRAPNFRIHRQDARYSVFTMYMIRCPGCSSWKEMAQFRCGNHWPKWWLADRHRWGANLWPNWDGVPISQDFINRLRCHSCYAAEHGRDALAKVLLEWYCECLVAELWLLHNHLVLGWGLAWDSFDTERSKFARPGDWYAAKQYHFDIRSEAMSGLPWIDPHDKQKGVSYFKLDADALKRLNQKHKLLKNNLGTWYVLEPYPIGHAMSEWNDWFGSWVSGYDNLEAQWIWFEDCKQEIYKRPEAIVEWALGDKGSVDVHVPDIWRQAAEKLSKSWSSPQIKDI